MSEANASTFQDGETVYFRIAKNGELYVLPKDDMGLDRGVVGSATIDHIDAATKTIYFSTSLPEAVQKWNR